MSLAGLKVKVSGLHSFWKVPGQNLFPCLFQLLESDCIPCLFSTLLGSLASFLTFLIDPLHSSCKDTCNYIKSTLK